jgi:hypothetical protein
MTEGEKWGEEGEEEGFERRSEEGDGESCQRV